MYLGALNTRFASSFSVRESARMSRGKLRESLELSFDKHLSFSCFRGHAVKPKVITTTNSEFKDRALH